MPSWVTDELGRWFPKKEKVALKNNGNEAMVNPSATWSNHYGEVIQPGEPYIYEGPDRAAMLQLFEEKTEWLGSDFHMDPELISRVKQLGYPDVESYAVVMGYDRVKAKKRFEEATASINKHEPPPKVKPIDALGGGLDTTGGGQDTKGGFGEPQLNPVK